MLKDAPNRLGGGHIFSCTHTCNRITAAAGTYA
jgi:hypothetical protein